MAGENRHSVECNRCHGNPPDYMGCSMCKGSGTITISDIERSESKQIINMIGAIKLMIHGNVDITLKKIADRLKLEHGIVDDGLIEMIFLREKSKM